MACPPVNKLDAAAVRARVSCQTDRGRLPAQRKCALPNVASASQLFLVWSVVAVYSVTGFGPLVPFPFARVSCLCICVLWPSWRVNRSRNEADVYKSRYTHTYIRSTYVQ